MVVERLSALLWFFPYHYHHLHHVNLIRRTDGQSLDTIRGTIFRISQHLTQSDVFVVPLFAETWVNLVL